MVSLGTTTFHPPGMLFRAGPSVSYGCTNQRRLVVPWAREGGALGDVPSILCKVLPRCVRSRFRSISLHLPAFDYVNAASAYFVLDFSGSVCPHVAPPCVPTTKRKHQHHQARWTELLWRPVKSENKYQKKLELNLLQNSPKPVRL